MELILVNIGIVGCLLLVFTTLVFIVARLTHDNSVMDIAYGPAFFVGLMGTAILTDTSGVLPAVVIGCVGIWSWRLSSRIFKKNLGKPEDARYAKWRTEWMQKGRLYFLLRSYLQINLLQALIILAVSLPGIIALSFPNEYSLLFLTLGLLVFIIGLTYETIADWQLDSFIARKKAGTEDAPLMKKGLFRYSRRPNYFGESLIWWGLALMVLPLPFGFIALISPLLITYIVTQVTGPMLEAHFMEQYPTEYAAYKHTTNYFIPGPPKTE